MCAINKTTNQHFQAMKLNLLLFLSASFLSASADTVLFSYDSAGNRVKREIVIEKKSAPSNDGADCFSDMLSEKEIKIYPNPTEGLLKVEISGYEDLDDCRFSIYNMSGQQIWTSYVRSPLTEVDITSRPNGMYIFLIALNGEESTWKIIKR